MHAIRANTHRSFLQSTRFDMLPLQDIQKPRRLRSSRSWAACAVADACPTCGGCCYVHPHIHIHTMDVWRRGSNRPASSTTHQFLRVASNHERAPVLSLLSLVRQGCGAARRCPRPLCNTSRVLHIPPTPNAVCIPGSSHCDGFANRWKPLPSSSHGGMRCEQHTSPPGRPALAAPWQHHRRQHQCHHDHDLLCTGQP
ncbi:hypothetical protein P154DRAFT_156634 [Amniculicola lignicola CBS 123094]|uniref:Uncharacterized protein n=1 Tax=Amniculicola lignicola CBS 123094 TaxID=1392246 RepID=A0A6A5WLT7_9PLEO|nr:hypothetical protein P154DRAFT_156634 [Amniculicola lignicola CBS 123094]